MTTTSRSENWDRFGAGCLAVCLLSITVAAIALAWGCIRWALG